MKLAYDKLLSHCALNSNLRLYLEADDRAFNETARANALSGELAAARDEVKLIRAGAANAATLDAQLCAATESNERLSAEVSRLEQLVAESYGQGLTLVHFSARPEPFLTQNTPRTSHDTP